MYNKLLKNINIYRWLDYIAANSDLYKTVCLIINILCQYNGWISEIYSL
jgi:hypothetical protein